jgi:regulator of extracellular matrix RemA (YlzA/DUF370 family)
VDSVDFIDVGMGNYVLKANIVAVVDANSIPSRNALKAAKEAGKAIDMTKGRKTHSFVLCKDGYVASSVLMPATMIRRMTKTNGRTKEPPIIINRS